MKPWSALFDWDGVLVDSSALHERSWDLLAEEEGLPLPPDHFKRGYGMKNETIIPDLLRWTRDPAEIRRLSLRKEALFRRLARDGRLAPLPGARALLAKLARRNIPRAIASSTHRLNIETLLDALKLGGFSAIVSAEDVARGKPDPEVFVKAAERPNCRPGSASSSRTRMPGSRRRARPARASSPWPQRIRRTRCAPPIAWFFALTEFRSAKLNLFYRIHCDRFQASIAQGG